jgi:hypothetical protein
LQLFDFSTLFLGVLMQDRPTGIELIDAVAQFLGDEVIPVITDPRLRYRLLIAANVLKIVRRELAVGDSSLRDEWGRLALLLDRPEAVPPAAPAELRAALEALNRELCARIRAGEADQGPWGEAVLAHTQAAIIEKLRVANPRYLDETEQP